jgi:epoxyqueuosine reductase
MTIPSGRVKRIARSLGADLAGIASADRFTAAPEGHRPSDILEDAASVVVLALRINRGAMVGPATSYQSAMDAVHRRLDELAGRLALFLDDAGGRAVPVPSDEPYRYWDAARTYGRGDLSHKHAAEAAGLGRLGRNSMLMTPKFGNRVHLVSIVTDVKLVPDSRLDWDPCPPGCARCIKACPVGAIIDGPSVDQAKCRPVVMLRLPKGAVVEACWACRKACPVGE